MELVFLGTGGGRYATAKQTRQTGGVLLKTDKTQIHIDPGPGAIYHSNKQLDKPEDTEATIISHAHLDHYSDAESIIEQITQVNEYPGTIFANETVLNGYQKMDQAISSYHKNLCQNKFNLNKETNIEYKNLVIKSQELNHADPKTVGFKISNKDACIGFWTDTKPEEELISFYEDVDTLVINALISRKNSSKRHTSISDIPDLIRKIKPETAIVTHFGEHLLKKNRFEENHDWLKAKCSEIDTKIVFADDNMHYPGNKSLSDF